MADSSLPLSTDDMETDEQDQIAVVPQSPFTQVNVVHAPASPVFPGFNFGGFVPRTVLTSEGLGDVDRQRLANIRKTVQVKNAGTSPAQQQNTCGSPMEKSTSEKKTKSTNEDKKQEKEKQLQFN